MAISYVDQGGAVLVVGTAVPAYPATVLPNDFLILHVTSDATGIGSPASGWAELGSESNAAGVWVRTFYRSAVGGETGTVPVPAAGAKGVAFITRYRDSGATRITPVQFGYGLDTDTSSTAIAATDGSVTTAAGDVIAASMTVLAAAAGTFTAFATGPSVTQAGATVTTSSKFSARTGTNTLSYNHSTGTVTTGGTGAPTFTATAVGANAGGIASFAVLRENVPLNLTATPADTVGITDTATAAKGGDTVLTDPVAITDTVTAPLTTPSGAVISYIDQGGAAVIATAGAPAYPPTVLAGDFLILFAFSDSSALAAPTALGWHELGSMANAAGVYARTFYRVAVGGETGTVLINAPGGTKGEAHIARFRSGGLGVGVVASGYGLDTDTTSTAFVAATRAR